MIEPGGGVGAVTACPWSRLCFPTLGHARSCVKMFRASFVHGGWRAEGLAWQRGAGLASRQGFVVFNRAQAACLIPASRSCGGHSRRPSGVPLHPAQASEPPADPPRLPASPSAGASLVVSARASCPLSRPRHGHAPFLHQEAPSPSEGRQVQAAGGASDRGRGADQSALPQPAARAAPCLGTLTATPNELHIHLQTASPHTHTLPRRTSTSARTPCCRQVPWSYAPAAVHHAVFLLRCAARPAKLQLRAAIQAPLTRRCNPNSSQKLTPSCSQPSLVHRCSASAPQVASRLLPQAMQLKLQTCWPRTMRS